MDDKSCECAFFYQYETVDFPIKVEYCDGSGGVLQGYKEIMVTLSQGGVIINKGAADLGIDVDEDIITLHLSQEETALFAATYCEIQVNIYYEDTERDTTTRGKIVVEKNLYKEYMS